MERKDGTPVPDHVLIFSSAFQLRVISTICLIAWNRLQPVAKVLETLYRIFWYKWPVYDLVLVTPSTPYQGC